MRKLIITATALASLVAAMLPAFGGYDRVNCHDLPRDQWVKCVWDINADQAGE